LLDVLDVADTWCQSMLCYASNSVSICVQELYGWSMDAIVKEIGLKNNCML